MNVLFARNSRNRESDKISWCQLVLTWPEDLEIRKLREFLTIFAAI